MGVDIDGLTDVLSDLDQLEDDYTGDTSWVVGTAVNYSIYLEFGTSKMDPRPFFRPAIRDVQSKGVDGFIESTTELTIDDIESAEELVQTVAFGLERKIKQIITRKGIIDTGTLRASIQAIPVADVSALPTEADFPDVEGNDTLPADFSPTAEADINL